MSGRQLAKMASKPRMVSWMSDGMDTVFGKDAFCLKNSNDYIVAIFVFIINRYIFGGGICLLKMKLKNSQNLFNFI